MVHVDGGRTQAGVGDVAAPWTQVSGGDEACCAEFGCADGGGGVDARQGEGPAEACAAGAHDVRALVVRRAVRWSGGAASAAVCGVAGPSTVEARSSRDGRSRRLSWPVSPRTPAAGRAHRDVGRPRRQGERFFETQVRASRCRIGSRLGRASRTPLRSRHPLRARRNVIRDAPHLAIRAR